MWSCSLFKLLLSGLVIYIASSFSLPVVQFPHICSYQAATYRVTVSQVNDNVTWTVGPLSYPERDEPQVMVKMPEDLRPNRMYTATVIVETIATNVSNSIIFSKCSKQ